MSNTMLIEAQSGDPYVQKLARNAIRILNDPTLERWQRERHIRRLQGLLVKHQAKVEAKVARLAEKQARKAEQSAGDRDGGSGSVVVAKVVANPSQVAARRRELEGGRQKGGELKRGHLNPRAILTLVLPVVAPKTQSANDASQMIVKRA